MSPVVGIYIGVGGGSIAPLGNELVQSSLEDPK